MLELFKYTRTQQRHRSKKWADDDHVKDEINWHLKAGGIKQCLQSCSCLLWTQMRWKCHPLHKDISYGTHSAVSLYSHFFFWFSVEHFSVHMVTWKIPLVPVWLLQLLTTLVFFQTACWRRVGRHLMTGCRRLCSQKVTKKRSIAFCVFLRDVTQEVTSQECINFGEVFSISFYKYFPWKSGYLGSSHFPTETVYQMTTIAHCLYAKLGLILLWLN